MKQCNAKTAYYFLLGNPVAHSLSPLIHNAGFEALGLNAVYLAAPVKAAELGSAVKGLKALEANGCNVTSPYKEAVIPYLDQVADEAKAISSVNTIVYREGLLYGTSTDGEGFFQALLKEIPDYCLDKPVLLIGAGGSARALAYTLTQKGLKDLYLANRSVEKAEKMSALLKEHTPLNKCHTLPLTGAGLKEALITCDLIVYSLPLDAEEVQMVLDHKEINCEGKHFFDLRYSPAKTKVMKTAAGAGAITHNGLGLLFRQALLAFELFTGRAAPEEQMALALKRHLEKEQPDDRF
jgi:shikimate dehydrogenase